MDFFWFVVIVVVLGLVYRSWRDLGTSTTTTPIGTALRQRGSGDFDVEVVGESHYQDALLRVAGSGEVRHACEARLVLEDDNPYDSQAVRVDMGGQTVGYLSRTDARRYRARVTDKGLSVSCSAVIVGGGAGRSLGVWLDLPLE